MIGEAAWVNMFDGGFTWGVTVSIVLFRIEDLLGGGRHCNPYFIILQVTPMEVATLLCSSALRLAMTASSEYAP